jgi:hypothetical protein
MSDNIYSDYTPTKVNQDNSGTDLLYPNSRTHEAHRTTQVIPRVLDSALQWSAVNTHSSPRLLVFLFPKLPMPIPDSSPSPSVSSPQGPQPQSASDGCWPVALRPCLPILVFPVGSGSPQSALGSSACSVTWVHRTQGLRGRRCCLAGSLGPYGPASP